jgi:hypothetical protein
LVRGKVTESSSGKSVAGAFVAYHATNTADLKKQNIIANFHTRVNSRADGTYQIDVPPGQGYLLVNGPTPDYIPRTIGSGDLFIAKPGGDPLYYHEVVSLRLKAKEKIKEVPIKLRRGVTPKGRLVGPDGKPVRHAVLFCASHPVPSL